MSDYYDHHSRLAEHHQRLAAEYEDKRQGVLSDYEKRVPKYFDPAKGQEMPRYSMENWGGLHLHDHLANVRDDHMRMARHHSDRADAQYGEE